MIGIIIAYFSDKDPPPPEDETGEVWLICDGRTIKQDDYPLLYQKIHEMFMPSNDPGNFKLPDLRGQSIRGLDSGSSGRDPDVSSRLPANANDTANGIGSTQPAAIPKHSHSASDFGCGNPDSGITVVSRDQILTGGSTDIIKGVVADPYPINAYVNFIIRAQ